MDYVSEGTHLYHLELSLTHVAHLEYTLILLVFCPSHAELYQVDDSLRKLLEVHSNPTLSLQDREVLLSALESVKEEGIELISDLDYQSVLVAVWGLLVQDYLDS